MAINRLDNGRYTCTSDYELVCDVCGEVGVSQGTFSECVDYAKENKWKSKSYRTKDSFRRYQWTHYCKDCKRRLTQP